MNNPLQPFHLAIPVNDLDAARRFYGGVLECPEGRSSNEWIDFDLFGHQLVVHLDPAPPRPRHTNEVDGHDVPVPHFGVVLEWNHWHRFADGLKAKGVAFGIEPHIRFRGQPGEQATLFFQDPAGNALEFKAFRNLSSLFAK
jgi:extradiol dioxygenase family protein